MKKNFLEDLYPLLYLSLGLFNKLTYNVFQA